MTAVKLELPQEHGPRGPAPSTKQFNIGALVDVRAILAERPLTAVARLERLERELVDLLTRQTPTFWRAERRRVWRLFRSAHHELTAIDRDERRTAATIVAPAGAQQPARRKIPAGRGARTACKS